jgi:hypothetical protein
MATTFKFYHDSALTTEITSGNPMVANWVSGTTSYADQLIYFGSVASGTKAQDQTVPGTNPIVVSVADSNSGTGAPATEFKLALSSGALAGATAGASLSLSNTVLSGVANAIPIYTRRTSALTVAGTYTDISLTTQTLIEKPV